MSKLKYDQSIFDIDGMPEDVKSVAVDKYGRTWLYKNIPEQVTNGWNGWSGDNIHIFIFEHDYTGRWEDSLLIRQQIKIGDFVKRWDYDIEPSDDLASFGYVNGIIQNEKISLRFIVGGIPFEHVRLFNPSARKE
jgi:hypothetical protein